jgi:sec-independent protein translocase protein TatC
MATEVLNPASSDTVEEQEGLQMSFLDHLDELRHRLVYSVVAIMVAFCVCFYFSDRIFNFLAVPVKQQLRKMRISAQMINGQSDLSQLKENEVAQYTFVQESAVGGVKIPLGTTVHVKSILKDGKQQAVLSEPWAIGKNVLPVGKPLSEILSGGGGEVIYDENEDLVISKVGGAFSLYMTIALYTGIALAIPFLFYQVWAFISPGLYRHEKRYAVPVVMMSAVFFALGAAFAYRIAFSRACEYLLGLQQEGRFRTLINAEDYFDLIIMIMLGLGVVFQIPTLSFLLGRIGLLTPKVMWKYWRYAVVLIFIIAALLTPTPDAYNLILFALPMLGLYFISIGIVWIFGKPRQTDDEFAANS